MKLRLISNSARPRAGKGEGKGCENMRPLFTDWFRVIEKRYESRSKQYAKSPCLLAKRLTASLNPGEVAFLFAEPQTGSTALLLKILEEYQSSDFLLCFHPQKLTVCSLLPGLLQVLPKYHCNDLKSQFFFKRIGQSWRGLPVFTLSRICFFLPGRTCPHWKLKWRWSCGKTWRAKEEFFFSTIFVQWNPSIFVSLIALKRIWKS